MTARSAWIGYAAGRMEREESPMAGIKTKPTDQDVAQFIAAVAHPVRRADAKRILAMMEHATGEKGVMWGPSIIGFGDRDYRYASGHGGNILRIGFSPRKANLVFYILNGFAGQAEMLARLGKFRTSGEGEGCLYVNKLADIDLAVLEQMIAAGWAHSAELTRNQGC